MLTSEAEKKLISGAVANFISLQSSLPSKKENTSLFLPDTQPQKAVPTNDSALSTSALTPNPNPTPTLPPNKVVLLGIKPKLCNKKAEIVSKKDSTTKKVCEQKLTKNNKTAQKGARSKKEITKCAHVDGIYYASGMCKNCYHSKGRNKLATKCEHTDRKLYAHGVCKACYLRNYHKKPEKWTDFQTNQKGSVVAEGGVQQNHSVTNQIPFGNAISNVNEEQEEQVDRKSKINNTGESGFQTVQNKGADSRATI